MQARTQWTHSDVWSQLATLPEWRFKIGDRQNVKKPWNSDQRAILNATGWIDAGRGVIRHRGVSDGSDRARPLWRSHSARTEIFFADVLPTDGWFTLSCRSVGHLFQTITLALWLTVAIGRNWFCGYTLAPGFQCDGWHCKHLSSRFFYPRAKWNSLFPDYTGLEGDWWLCKNLFLRSFYLHPKCNCLFTNYTHHSNSQDLGGYWQSIACSVHLLSYY